MVAVVPSVDSVVQASSPIAPAPAVPDRATLSTPPTGTGPRSAMPGDTSEAERRCLEAARVMLAPPSADPAAALRRLSWCEQHYPRRSFPEAREQIRREAREAISEAGRKL